MRRRPLVLLTLIIFSCNSRNAPADKYTRINDTLIVQERYYDDGKLEAEISRSADSIRHGSAKLYYENGKLKKSYNNHHGKREGLVKAYYPNGSLLHVGKYSNDLQDSIWVWYYENGAIEIISNWTGGKQEGFEKGYYPNGKLKYTGMYHSDLQDSTWTWYYENGAIEHIENWQKGK